MAITKRILGTVLALHAATAAAQSDADYFPFKAGARYEYSGDAGDYTVEVLSVAGDQMRTRGTLKTGGPLGTLVYESEFRRSPTGITETRRTVRGPRGSGKAQETRVLQFPIAEGLKWKPMGGGTEALLIAMEVAVDVPAGEYRHCIRIDISQSGKPAGKDIYCSGVGLVRSAVFGDLMRISDATKPVAPLTDVVAYRSRKEIVLAGKRTKGKTAELELRCDTSSNHLYCRDRDFNEVFVYFEEKDKPAIRNIDDGEWRRLRVRVDGVEGGDVIVHILKVL